MTKKFVIISSLFIALAISLATLSACATANTANTVTLRYELESSEMGDINGARNQLCNSGEDGTLVTALPNDNYMFVKWSDGLTTPDRIDKNVTSNISVVAIFATEAFSINYTASAGGEIKGETTQIVAWNKHPTPVEAVPHVGYKFAGWSDGEMEPLREYDYFYDDLDVCAYFEKITENTFSFDYNYATKNDSIEEINLEIGKLHEAVFPIPEKDHSIFGGWYLDKDRTIAITDNIGNVLKEDILFESVENNTLYAKWTAKKKMTYKILLVFVDEVQATLHNLDRTEMVDIDYKLSKTERRICEMIPSQYENLLNEIFYGYINFEVDSYFTKQVVTTKMFEQIGGGNPRPHSLMAHNIPEVVPMLNDYRSVITTFSLNSYDKSLVKHNGLADIKHAQVSLDNKLYPFQINNVPFENFFDTNYHNWDNILSTYLHEFTHTVGICQDYYNYHDYLDELLTSGLSSLELTKLYLLNQAEIDGNMEGIPHDAWTGDNYTFRHRYWSYNHDGGSIVKSKEPVDSDTFWDHPLDPMDPPNFFNPVNGATIPYGDSVTDIVAVPHPGYKFVKWSDGSTNPRRNDINITSNINFFAVFEKK